MGFTNTAWLRVLRAESAPTASLLCLPPGGGSATAYRALAAALPAGIEVVAVQYPGRQDRLADPLCPDLHALADAIAAEVGAQPGGAPLTVFGHSMGATVAYETVRRLRAAGRPVARLVVSARPAPDVAETGRLHLGPDSALIDDLERLAADPAPVRVLRDEPGLAELVLPAVRADYRAVETYRPRPGAPLDLPVLAFAADADPTTSPAQAAGWKAVTTGEFAQREFPGGHFYLDQDPAAVAAALAATLIGVSG
ncbi:thioesterase II family protein [Nocardia thailandica]|uniref:Thioesterase TesA n=1 Tax=Nocardia thailandica TaxID=257275 RepID=A0ABW6PMK1_9NOCA|nr:alpha/beta fold hydrolase [Nocardia thailandica]